MAERNTRTVLVGTVTSIKSDKTITVTVSTEPAPALAYPTVIVESTATGADAAIAIVPVAAKITEKTLWKNIWVYRLWFIVYRFMVCRLLRSGIGVLYCLEYKDSVELRTKN